VRASSVLLENTRLGWKGLVATIALAYNTSILIIIIVNSFYDASKLFTIIINIPELLARAIVADSHFHPSLIFSSKTRALTCAFHCLLTIGI
jgi:hypothetical protein